MRTFDAIIIGAGQAGPSLAARLSAAGRTVAIIERKHVGGTCVNTGCKPTKALVASAHAAHIARRAADFGVVIGGGVTIDMPSVFGRSHNITLDSRHSNERWLEGLENCTLIRGHARFENRNTVRVGDERLSAPQIFINVGGRAAIPDFPGIHDVPYMTNSDIVMLECVPKHLVVVGGSYIGLEFAQMYRRFGAEVTVVEKSPRLVAREDAEISDAIRTVLEDEGIVVRTAAECIRFSRDGDDVIVGVSCTEGEPDIRGSDILLATGRTPNTGDLRLDLAGVAKDERGYIVVDDALATTAPGIWAMGDCNGRGAFTHTAYNDFEIVAANLLDGEMRRVSDRLPAYALYTDPPLGRVGMNEREALASGRRILVGRLPMMRVGRAVEKGETQGLMKIIADADTREILGAAILGTGGDEAIHGVLDMMNVGGRYDDLRWAVPIHPTISEFWPTLVLAMKPAEASS